MVSLCFYADVFKYLYSCCSGLSRISQSESRQINSWVIGIVKRTTTKFSQFYFLQREEHMLQYTSMARASIGLCSFLEVIAYFVIFLVFYPSFYGFALIPFLILFLITGTLLHDFCNKNTHRKNNRQDFKEFHIKSLKYLTELMMKNVRSFTKIGFFCKRTNECTLLIWVFIANSACGIKFGNSWQSGKLLLCLLLMSDGDWHSDICS